MIVISSQVDFDAAVKQAVNAAQAYYHTGSALMSDSEYDALVEAITIVADKQPRWAQENSDYIGLVDAVAAGTNDNGDVAHTKPMLSLKKGKTFDEIQAFFSSSNDSLPYAVVVEPKLDGTAVAARYEAGTLVQAVTRGDGAMGTDITARLNNVVGLPQTLTHDFTGEVRGELYMRHDQFEAAKSARLAYAKLLWERSEADKVGTKKRTVAWEPQKHTFANSRNAVSGLVNRDDPAPYPYEISFAAYDIDYDVMPDSYLDVIRFAEELGIQSAVSLIASKPEALKEINTLKQRLQEIGVERGNYDFPTDGAVVKIDNLNIRKRLGNGSRHPKWAVAYKYESETGVSTVRAILPSVGRTGRLALRAQIDPVTVAGTTIQYVSLHNAPWVLEKDIRVGDTVLVARNNDVIPQIQQVISHEEDSLPWEPPSVCPKCGEPWNKETMLWRCETPSCGAVNAIIHAAKRDFFDWDGMSEAIITRLSEQGRVSTIADVFTLTKADLATTVMRHNDDGKPIFLGETNAAKIHAQIQRSKETPLEKVLGALGIRTLGRTFGRRLSKHFGSMKAIQEASVDDLLNVEGIAIKKAVVIHQGLKNMSGVIAALQKAGVKMESSITVGGAQASSSASSAGILDGMNVCVTGSMAGTKLDGMSRNQVNALIEDNGGRAASSVSSSTHLLVASGSGSSKHKKAESLGIKIVTPDEFYNLVHN